jgi:isochorismate synthase
MAAHENNYAIAAWKNIRKNTINLIIDTSDTFTKPIIPDLEIIEPGFLVSPFFNESNHLSYLIKADLHFKGTQSDSLFLQTYRDQSVTDEFLSSIPDKSQESKSEYFKNKFDRSPNINETEFKDLVRLAINRIKDGDFLKVVPSRRKAIDLKESFNLPEAFVSLLKQYPDAFVSFFSIPGKGTWIGASPEILIEIDSLGIFRTSAIAGTQPWHPETELSSVGWTQKEIEEQAYVSRYIINSFKKIRLREFEEYGPKTIRAGNLVHLRTDFKVNLNEVNFPQLGSVMLKLLHPTSAVCGMPKEPAMTFLKSYENYDREFYSGFLGPVNVDNYTSLFVNLRCAQLLDRKAYLYAGAGVTSDSNPDKEWRETLIKNQTIQEILSLKI